MTTLTAGESDWSIASIAGSYWGPLKINLLRRQDHLWFLHRILRDWRRMQKNLNWTPNLDSTFYTASSIHEWVIHQRHNDSVLELVGSIRGKRLIWIKTDKLTMKKGRKRSSVQHALHTEESNRIPSARKQFESIQQNLLRDSQSPVRLCGRQDPLLLVPWHHGIAQSPQ